MFTTAASNIQVEARVIATVGHGFESKAIRPDDEVCAQSSDSRRSACRHWSGLRREGF
jgi:hypothetical protein